MRQERNNTAMMLIVEQGIAHDTQHGAVHAWCFLMTNAVPDEVILRVLSDPAKRRSKGLPAAYMPSS